MNSYFQFKQFIIHQENCAMKVTEMACIQGAWTKVPATANRLLDIGCGTGLLSLMMAQKNPQVRIDAVEIDEMCMTQAKQNILASPFGDRIQCIQADIKSIYSPSQYDFIICNPPFYEKQLRSEDVQKNKAWHSTALSLEELFGCIEGLLNSEGRFSLLLPNSRTVEVERLATRFGFYAQSILYIRHSVEHAVSHVVFIFSRKENTLVPESLQIRSGRNYTPEFRHLLTDFYLKL